MNNIIQGMLGRGWVEGQSWQGAYYKIYALSGAHI